MKPLQAQTDAPLMIHAPTAAAARHLARGHERFVVVGRCNDYQTAEQAVDILVSRGFPVERLRIRGTDLQLLEQVTGALSYRGVLVRGSVIGGLAGVLLGLVFGVAGLLDPLLSTVRTGMWAAVLGAAVGAGLASLRRWLQEGRRDFLSRTSVVAGSYHLLCDADATDEATRLLEAVITSVVPAPPPGDERA